MADVEVKRGYVVLPDNTVQFGIRVINNSEAVIIDVEGDSKLVVNQVAGSWQVNKDNLKPLNAEAKALLSKFKSAKVEWIPREKNARADAAASRALVFDEGLGVGQIIQFT